MKTENDIAKEEFKMKAAKKGGKIKVAPKKLAAGGVGKLRHKQTTKSGKALTRAEFNKKRI